MMTEEEALELVLKKVISKTPDCSILSEETESHDACYVFYYQSNQYISSGKLEDMYVGHGPVIVCRETYEVFETGSSRAPLEYIDTFKACGDPNAVLTGIVEIFDWREGANTTKATKLIRNFSHHGLADAKNIIDRVLEGHAVSFTVADITKAQEVSLALISNNFAAEQLWSNKVSRKNTVN